MLEAQIYEGDASIRRSLGKILDQVQIELIRLKNGQVDNATAITNLNAQMAELTKAHKELATALAAAAERAEVEKIQHNIEAGAQLAQLFGKIAFSNDPASAYRINVGARAIATIAGGAVSLSHGGLDTGAKILTSLSMGNAALSVISMFGPFGKDQTTELIEAGFSSIRSDIHNLSLVMNERFDRIEAGMQAIYARMNDRFDKLDRQYDRLRSQLDALDRAVKEYYGVTSEALAAALSQPYWVAYKTCTAPGIEKYLDVLQLHQCMAQMTVFAALIADQKVLSGQVLFDFRLPAEEAAPQLDKINSQYQAGFLQSSLINSAAHPVDLPAPLLGLSPSPYVWSSVVDAYFANLELGPKLKAPISKEALAEISIDDTSDLIKAGNSALKTVGALRRAGVDVALQIYRRKVSEVADKLGKAAVAELTHQDVQITKDVGYADAIGGFYDNDGLKIELRRGTQIATVVGPHQENLTIHRYRRRILPRMDLRGGMADRKIESWLNLARTQWVKDDAHYPLSSYEPNEIVTTEGEIRKTLDQANTLYLAEVPRSQLTQAAADLIDKEWSRFTQTKADLDLAKGCLGLSNARLYVMELALFARTESSLDERWLRALEQLPGAATAPAGAECAEIIALLKDAAMPSDLDKQQVAKRYFSAWVENVLSARAEQFSKVYKETAVFESDLPEVEMRMKRLETLPHL
jgi:hypothetical protein